jgi:Arc/MetJ-type ribon-helix-helix transcriptional regulator
MSISTRRIAKRAPQIPQRKSSTVKVAFTIDQTILLQLDRLVRRRIFPSRSKAIREAIHDKLARANHTRLATECAKLDSRVEQALAEEGMATELAIWPKY